ncbi:hypothetical protein [Geomonas agri]|uniref:hypothetical protein n=1 Tax=Geomonas agri TaxID=2873702 RepID=UPI001CD1F499|nr:hypothetical protein [Geomonas agri]
MYGIYQIASFAAPTPLLKFDRESDAVSFLQQLAEVTRQQIEKPADVQAFKRHFRHYGIHLTDVVLLDDTILGVARQKFDPATVEIF